MFAVRPHFLLSKHNCMKKITSLLAVLLFFAGIARSQSVAVSGTPVTPDASAMLEVNSTAKGFLPPRMTTVQRDAISNPAAGLVIYNSTTGCLNYRSATAWLELCGTCSPLPTTANAGTDQLNLAGTAATLAGNAPVNGTGLWSIVSGAGGDRKSTRLNSSHVVTSRMPSSA